MIKSIIQGILFASVYTAENESQLIGNSIYIEVRICEYWGAVVRDIGTAQSKSSFTTILNTAF